MHSASAPPWEQLAALVDKSLLSNDVQDGVEPRLRMRAVMMRALADPAAAETALRLASALHWFWLRLALELHDERGFAASRSLLGETARFKGHYERATDLLETALAQETRLGGAGRRYPALGCAHALRAGHRRGAYAIG